MAHFAKLDDSNIVLEVVVVNNLELLDSNGQENEELGIAFLSAQFGHVNWKQTSYNGNFRKNYAGIGYTYNLELDAFITISPFASWLLDVDTCTWVPPVPYPSDGAFYNWNEQEQQWELRQL
jgi:hypothetical protein